jgi:hypothetical protein
MLIDTGWHLLSFFTEGKDVPLQQILPFVCFGFFLCDPVFKNQFTSSFAKGKSIDI